ncbi:hypothetical protein HNY73_014376 [Argiope bruennichi]|uniref:C2H2-type domain-containing protein n=1 Tax=Argiope bruennichi TaxID=94029 RepID=A0A8T0EQF8_ARGBR|nr:hypothetical protein HNY73_014376 [Argiope bruennichi]
MNQENQVYFSENAQASVPQQSGSGNSDDNQLASTTQETNPLSQESDNSTTVASHLHTELQPHLQIISSGNEGTPVAESPATIESASENRLASTTLALSSLSQEGDNPTIFSSHLHTEFQPHLQITSAVESPATTGNFNEKQLASARLELSPLSLEADNPTIVASHLHTEFRPDLQIKSERIIATLVEKLLATTGSSSENQLASTTQESSPLTQEADNPQTVESHLHTELQPHLQIISSGNEATPIAESPATTGSSSGNQLASSTRVLSPPSQEADTPTIIESHLHTQFQPHLQITSPGNAGAFVAESSPNTESFSENQLASTTRALNTLSQEAENPTTVASHLHTDIQPHMQIVSSRNAATSVAEYPPNIGSSSENQLALSLLSQEAGNPTIVASHLHTQFQPDLQITSSVDAAISVAESPTTYGSSSENQRASKTRESSPLSQESDNPTTFASHLPTELQPYLQIISPVNAETSESPETIGISIENQSTFQASTSVSKLEGKFPNIISLLKSPPKNQDTAVRAGQKSKCFSTSRQKATLVRSKSVKEILSAAKTASAGKQLVSAHLKQKSLSSPVEITPSLRKQVLVERLRKETKKLSRESKRQLDPTGIRSPEIVDLGSPDKLTTDPDQSSEISGESSSSSQQQPHTSSHESPLKNLRSQHSLTDKKDVNRIERRLVLFDKFICVKCLVGFTSQEELLRHEPIHFNE